MRDAATRVARAVERITGARASEVRRLTGGASAETWSADAGSENVILRRDAGEIPLDGLAISKRVEARAQEAARRVGVPAAEVLGLLDLGDELGEGYVMRRLVGESLPKRILTHARFDGIRGSLAARCGEILAAMHTASIDDVEGLTTHTVASQLDALVGAYRGFGPPRPVFELAIRHLRATMPGDVTPRLVHGDFRNGNLLVTEDGITGVLDFEMTHAGDPAEDLGWLMVNAWRFGVARLPVGGFGTRRALFDAYTRGSGREVDEARVRYWEILGTLKWGVVCLHQVSAFETGRVRTLERAAIGRRIAEVEIDLLDLVAPMESTS